MGASTFIQAQVWVAHQTGEMMPVVQQSAYGTAIDNGDGTQVIKLDFTPKAARQAGLDLIAAANQAISDAAMREYCRTRGYDQDEMVGMVRAATNAVLAAEKEG
jgi:hypothetical protein